ncbi:MAG: hypothetical protein ACM3TR_07550 [Caulobacteraceae bacterium]
MNDVIPIIKNKQWKVLVIYSTVITAAYIFTILYELGVRLPSPANPLKHIVTSIVGK